MRNTNRINVACSRAMEALMIAATVNKIMKKRIHLRRHFDNVFDHGKILRAEWFNDNQQVCQFILNTVLRANVKDKNEDAAIVETEITKDEVQKIIKNGTKTNSNLMKKGSSH